MYVGRRCSRETQEDWSRKRYTQKVKRKLGFLCYTVSKKVKNEREGVTYAICGTFSPVAEGV